MFSFELLIDIIVGIDRRVGYGYWVDMGPLVVFKYFDRENIYSGLVVRRPLFENGSIT